MIAILFILFLFMEAGFAVFSMAKQTSRREWIRNRLLVNAFELLLYISMTLLPGIDFSFRFKAFLWLLILRGIIALLRFRMQYKKAEGKKKLCPWFSAPS